MRTEAEWQARERELLEACNRYLERARAAERTPSPGLGEDLCAVDPILVSGAAHDVICERYRQIRVEGWTAKHDNQHQNGEIAGAAAAYAAYRSHTSPQTLMGYDIVEMIWPWSPLWWKPTNRRRDLVKAGALILAEIERLDRADRSSS